jgi:hypothetical protein
MACSCEDNRGQYVQFMDGFKQHPDHQSASLISRLASITRNPHWPTLRQTSSPLEADQAEA